jgi:hypothetical protein
MKVYKDLELHLDGLSLDEWLTRAAPFLQANWRRSADLEQKARTFGVGSDPYLCFELHNDPSHSPAVLVLAGRAGARILDVINIVSGQKSELSHDEYNCLLEKFAAEVIRPSIAGTGARCTTSEGEVPAAELMNPAVAKLLEQFSGLANKSTGSSHPYDQERWFAFIAAAHRSGHPLGVDQLGRWLVEHGGWSSERAHELTIEYEQALALLSYYDQHGPE